MTDDSGQPVPIEQVPLEQGGADIPPPPKGVSTDVILSDRPCIKCGYNLQGLNIGSRCPECGTPIRPKRNRTTRLVDNLTDAPKPYLQKVALGAVSLAVCVVLGVAGFVSNRAGVPLAAEAGAIVGGALWVFGVWFVATPRPLDDEIARDPLLESAKLRDITRWGSFTNPAAFFLLSAAVAGNVAVLIWIGFAVQILFFLSLAPLCVYLSALADWAGDTSLGGRFRGCAWAIAVLGPLTVLGWTLATLASPIFGLPSVFMTIILGITGLVVMVGILQIATTSLWAIQNAESAREREIRIANKKAEEAERAAERVTRTDAGDAADAGGLDAFAVPDPITPGFVEDDSIPDAIPLAGDDEPDEIDAALGPGKSSGNPQPSKIKHQPRGIESRGTTRDDPGAGDDGTPNRGGPRIPESKPKSPPKGPYQVPPEPSGPPGFGR